MGVVAHERDGVRLQGPRRGRPPRAGERGLVQDGELQANYAMIPALIPDEVQIEHVDQSLLPENWRESAGKTALQQIGQAWTLTAHAAVLAVPSAIIPIELNYLLNPQHPDFQKIQIGLPQAFVTDLRLLKK